jgi:hypothetical protein
MISPMVLRTMYTELEELEGQVLPELHIPFSLSRIGNTQVI